MGAGSTVILVVVVFALKWFRTDSIYPFCYPHRWIGYLAAAFLIYGTGEILINRMIYLPLAMYFQSLKEKTMAHLGTSVEVYDYV